MTRWLLLYCILHALCSVSTIASEVYEKEMAGPVSTGGQETEGEPDQPEKESAENKYYLKGDPVKNEQDRYHLHGSKWKIRRINYKIVSWPSHFDHDDVRDIIRKAFEEWARVSTLTFDEETREDAKPLIEISFVTGDHGDNKSFTGGAALAHAFFPLYGGNIHFDKDKDWTIDPISLTKISLFYTAVHEIGHSLGLKHFDSYTLVMAPYHKQSNFKTKDILGEGDIKAIQDLYGVPEGYKESSELRQSAPNDHLCRNFKLKVDALFSVGNYDERLYVFLGELYWLYIEGELIENYPKVIERQWRDLTFSLDAGFASHHHFYLFKGDKYWRTTNLQLDEGYPRLIKDGFPGIPNSLNAVVQLANSDILFFKGGEYWRYDINEPTPTSNKNPHSIGTVDNGSLKDIFQPDAAFMRGGNIYLTKNGHLFIYDVDHAKVYPQPDYIGKSLFKCDEGLIPITNE